jgi:ribosome-binding factor A
MKRQSPKVSGRDLKICEQISQDLATLIQFELKDPRVKWVSITQVDITPDYAHAKIFFTTLLDDKAAVLEGLQRASGFLRTQLAKNLRIHTIPALHFTHDDAVVRGAVLEKLIEQANQLKPAEE